MLIVVKTEGSFCTYFAAPPQSSVNTGSRTEAVELETKVKRSFAKISLSGRRPLVGAISDITNLRVYLRFKL